MALARYMTDSSQAVAPAPTPRSRPIGDSAVAIIVELTGFSTAPA
jgi:hypothetical protein